MNCISKVQVWEEEIILPTYEVCKADKNPLFLERRVYQGSSGKVYPHPVIDKISDEKTNQKYTAVFLENAYLKIMILPALGGRVQRAYDKTRNYDFVYYNRVIKPALVGLAGPWISGGIEFNWPQHHRPSTFDEVNYVYSQNDDGSATVTVSEIEAMFHTKGETRFTLYPDKAYLELKNQLFNRTNTEQTFLWWANPAVSVNDSYYSVFPPDVTAVMDHGKRDVSTFPIATGTYYKVDYSAGVDISRYENLPVPTSYMAAKSDFDFVGGFDESKKAGILHIAEHQISPGKKQWTWGNGDFGKAWERNLTDDDGPYIELMTGCFTDNQPDFSFLAPMECREFTQVFLPYHDLGKVHNANRDVAVKLTVDTNIRADIYCSGMLGECEVCFFANGKKIFSEMCVLCCAETYQVSTENHAYRFEDITVKIMREGSEVLSFDGNIKKQEIPMPAAPIPKPQDCETNEDLFLYGMHISQYRHATRRAQDYYEEGLRRDGTDMRINNAYGMLEFAKGHIAESEKYFRNALMKQNRNNRNPKSGEVYYNLGRCLFYQERLPEAFDSFYKAAWCLDTKAAACCFLSAICAREGELQKALRFCEEALMFHTHNFTALNLKTMLLRKTGRTEEAIKNAKDTVSLDSLNIVALLESGENIRRHIINANMLIDLSLEYAFGGFYEEAKDLLDYDQWDFPLVSYYRAYYAYKAGKDFHSYLAQALLKKPDYCFPNRIEDVPVLKFAVSSQEKDDKAPYYLGNLLYDRECHEEAICCFEQSVLRGADFATPYRNLALLYFNCRGDKEKAYALLQTAFQMEKSDARLLYELDILKRRMGISPEKRLLFLETQLVSVLSRDDLCMEYITLLNLTGQYERAQKLLLSRRFHPWEGGEGKTVKQYLFSEICMALDNICFGNAADAIQHLERTFVYPENLGEGKLFGTQENRENYYLGAVYALHHHYERAKEYFEKAALGISEPVAAVYYNDRPPETIFYQGLALLRLGREEEAREKFHRLIAYAKEHYSDKAEIDYFAVSLPDLLVFEDDLTKKNQMHCLFMEALGLFGLGEKEKSKEIFDTILAENGNDFQAASQYQLLFKEAWHETYTTAESMEF